MTETLHEPNGDIVRLTVPAVGAYISTLRLTAAGLAARCDLTVDDIEDLRLAVDEACALLLPHVVAGSELTAEYELRPGALSVTVIAAPSGSGGRLDRSGFAWSVLSALASQVDVGDRDDRLDITVVKRRETASA